MLKYFNLVFTCFLSSVSFGQDWIFEYESEYSSVMQHTWKNHNNENTIHRVGVSTVPNSFKHFRTRLIELNEHGELVSFFACAAEQHEVLLGSSRLLVELNDLGCAFRSLCGHDLSHKKRGLDYQPPFCHPAGRGVVLAYAEIACQFLM